MHFHSPNGVVEQKLPNIITYGDHGSIVLNNADNYQGVVYIYNMVGQMLANQPLQPGIRKITQQPDGVYIVKAVIGKTIISRKVVID